MNGCANASLLGMDSAMGQDLDHDSLTGKILIAMPSLQDPNFERAVVCICAHSDEGALGLVINRPHSARMEDVLDQLGIPWGRLDAPRLHLGGPVGQERGFILYEHNTEIPGYMEVNPDLFMGTNPDILRHLCQPQIHERFFFALGYAGWSDGQLESEIRANAWLVSQLDHQLLFEVPLAQRWATAIRQMGFDPAQLMDAGAATN